MSAVCYNKTARNRSTARRVNLNELFLDDLSVLQHGHASALSHFPFYRDRFAGVLRQLIVHRFVIADQQVGFAFGYDADRSAAFDALGRATRVFITHRVVIDVAHHIDNFAGNFFGRRGVEILLARLRGEGQWRKRERGNKSDRDRHLQTSWNCGIEHARNVRSKFAMVNCSGALPLTPA